MGKEGNGYESYKRGSKYERTSPKTTAWVLESDSLGPVPILAPALTQCVPIKWAYYPYLGNNYIGKKPLR